MLNHYSNTFVFYSRDRTVMRDHYRDREYGL
jgi:hypothetical protein